MWNRFGNGQEANNKCIYMYAKMYMYIYEISDNTAWEILHNLNFTQEK